MCPLQWVQDKETTVATTLNIASQLYISTQPNNIFMAIYQFHGDIVNMTFIRVQIKTFLLFNMCKELKQIVTRSCYVAVAKHLIHSISALMYL